MTGYFSGTISGMGAQKIRNSNFTTPGDLEIDINDSHQYEYQISASVINDAFEVILGRN